MRVFLRLLTLTALTAILAACASGGIVGRDGNASGGSVSVGPINADVTPCVNMPGASSRDCKTQASGSSGTSK